jgi:hypothetical protein
MVFPFVLNFAEATGGELWALHHHQFLMLKTLNSPQFHFHGAQKLYGRTEASAHDASASTGHRAELQISSVRSEPAEPRTGSGNVAACSPNRITCGSRAIGARVSDELTVAVRRVYHRELHRHGDEAAWWTKVTMNTVLRPASPAGGCGHRTTGSAPHDAVRLLSM